MPSQIAELDLAELLSYPGVDLGRGERLLVARYADSQGVPAGEREGMRRRLDLAAIARSLDYAGTLTARYRRFAGAGLPELASVQLERRGMYLSGAVRRANSAGLPTEIVDFLTQIANRVPQVSP